MPLTDTSVPFKAAPESVNELGPAGVPTHTELPKPVKAPADKVGVDGVSTSNVLLVPDNKQVSTELAVAVIVAFGPAGVKVTPVIVTALLPEAIEPVMVPPIVCVELLNVIPVVAVKVVAVPLKSVAVTVILKGTPSY